ncbi:MAG: PorT family protein [Weeksellaceae bacterium]|nr:PorT family protein [Bacteroidota bacterium]MCG2781269.1 PorT family protein [Weeksellaceae bacterium]
MKKLFFVGALALFTAANAQTFGLKAGMNVSNLTNSDGAKSKIGLNAGVFMNAPLAESFSIQPELLYNGKGAKEDGSGGATLNLDYLSVPVMFQYNATPQFYLEAGPEFSFIMSAKAKGGGATLDVKDQINSFDFGIGLGAGYYFIPNFGLTARYVAGFTDIAKDNSGDSVKNNVFQVGLAYKFGK